MTDDELAQARIEVKTRVSRTRAKQKAKHWEQQFELRGSSGRNFRLFKRWNVSLPHVFSVGLDVVMPNGESLNLCRYNGAYHTHRNRLEGTKVPATYHVHVATERYISAGLSPDGYAEPTTRYRTVDGALRCLIEDCNIEGVSSNSDEPDDLTADLFDPSP